MIVVPVYNTIVAPYAKMYLQTEQFKKAARRDPKIGERVVFIVSRVNREREDMKVDEFQPIGVSGSISEINQQGFIVIDTANRVNIEEVIITPG
ncbi:MAG TPA: endopeptidase La, partial [Lachnospiraceae bacterium]|nr:endopeptidase La [Lachnospiraceae bacterium]